MPTNSLETAPGFWRCRRCGTPNPRADYLTKCLGCGAPVPPETSEPIVVRPVARPSTPSRPKDLGKSTLVGALALGMIVLAALGMLRAMSLEWWAVAALALMPRSIFAIPLVPLAIGAFRSRRIWVASVVAVDAWLVFGPWMGFSVPMGRPTFEGPRVRILSLNRGGAKLDESRLVAYLERHRIDVVCFQELAKDPGLEERLLDRGWSFDRARRIASRFPIVEDLGRSVDVNKSDARYTMTLFRARLRHPDGFEFVVGSAHLPTLRWGGNRLLNGDLNGFRLNLAWWDEEAGRLLETLSGSGDFPILVAGDFNMPGDYRGMASIRSSYPSAFDQAGWGYGYTRPTAWPWVRIDHILGSLDWGFSSGWVGPNFGSDHLPMIAEAVLRRPPG